MSNNIIVRLLSLVNRLLVKKTDKPSFSVRAFKPEDLQQVVEVEKQTFRGEHYPKFFFIQAGELFPTTFLVAESSQGQIVGYGIGAVEQHNPETGWILSMGVLPSWRRKKIGTIMMKSLISALEERGASTIMLSTTETNLAAVSLYTSLGFSARSQKPNYFGDGETRLIMHKLKPSSSRAKLPYRPELLMGETEISVSFVNVLFGVSAAVVAILATRPDVGSFALPLLYLFLTIFASFYSSIFYANTSGSLSRLGRSAEVIRPLRFGNIISEYLGVYPLVIAFPLIVWNITNDPLVTASASMIDLGGFVFYQASGFDILSRTITRSLAHRLTIIVILGLTVTQLLAEIQGGTIQKVISATMLVLLLTALVIIGARTPER